MIDLWEFAEFGAKQVGDATVGPLNLIYCNTLKSILLSAKIVGKAEILTSSGSQKLLVVILVWGRLNYWV